MIILGVVFDHCGCPSLGWWLTILGMVGDQLGNGSWGLNFWVKSVPNFKSAEYFLVVYFGEGCSSSCFCCDRGKSKSTPCPLDLDWNGLGLNQNKKDLKTSIPPKYSSWPPPEYFVFGSPLTCTYIGNYRIHVNGFIWIIVNVQNVRKKPKNGQIWCFLCSV